jgi:hypothetical protein
MATLAQKIEAEKRMRDLLDENGLPQADHVEYGFTCIRLFFNETKHLIIIDISKPEDTKATVDTDAAETGRRHRSTSRPRPVSERRRVVRGRR